MGQQADDDRVVFQFSGGIPAHRAEYTPQVWYDPRGTPVPLAGRAFVRVVFIGASQWCQQPLVRMYSGAPTLSPFYANVLQVSVAGDFEGYLSFGIGLSGHASFRVFTLTNPDRVVLDFTEVKLPPFPGIWDITSWRQYWIMQASFEEGHQPWRADARAVVTAWAISIGITNPAIRQTGADTFQVTRPGTTQVYTVTGTRPAPGTLAPLWVITRIAYPA